MLLSMRNFESHRTLPQVHEGFVAPHGGPLTDERHPSPLAANEQVEAPSSATLGSAAVNGKGGPLAARPREDTTTSLHASHNRVRKLNPGQGLALALPSDEGLVSTYQSLIRESFKFFQSQADDMFWHTQGRKNKVIPAQIGLRCRYCASQPLHWRGRGSVYFPGKLSSVYQAAQNMTLTHLLVTCKAIPDKVKEKIEKERVNQRIRDKSSGGKKYWVEACMSMGIGEREDVPGLWFC